MPTRHAILGPSSAYRWLTCTPSARFEEQIQEEESDYAAEGTLAHDLAALVLAYRAGHYAGNLFEFNDLFADCKARVLAFYEMIDNPNPEGEFDEMLKHCEDYAAFVIGFGGEILIEREYDLGQFVPLGFGTSDATNLTPDVLYITDLKYGAGMRVGAKDNSQLKLYGLGALLAAVLDDPTYKPSTVCVSIFQPRAGGASSYEIAVGDLLKWAEYEVAPKAALAIAGQGDFIAGGHCQFCKARNVCKAYFDKFADVKGCYDKRAMTPKDLQTVLTYGPLVSSWVKKVIEDATRQIQNGKTIKGFKVVAGRGKRCFTCEDDVVDVLIGEDFDSEQIFKSELRALTDLEKIVGAKRFATLFADLVINKEGGAVLVPEDDDRPAIGASAHDDYEDEDLT